MNIDQPFDGAEIQWFFTTHFYQAWMDYYPTWQEVVQEAAVQLTPDEKTRIVAAIHEFVAGRSDQEVAEFLADQCNFVLSKDDPSPNVFLKEIASMLLR